MQNNLDILKGIHPGIILGRELKKRKLRKNEFASMIDEHPQTLGSIIKEQRKMNTPLSLKIENALNLKEGFLMTLQVFYDIKKIKQEQVESFHPDLKKIRPVVFWDTDINKIDWLYQKNAVIQRIFERGNENEINEIIRFYGREIVMNVINKKQKLSRAVKKNKRKYLLIN